MKTRKGFTLTEIIIVSGFIAVLILLSVSLFIMGSNATRSAAADFDVQTDTRRAVETYTQVIRGATSIHTVSRESFTIAHDYKAEWAYIGVEELRDGDGNKVGDRLISLTPHPRSGSPAPYNNHDLTILVEAREGYTFKFSLAKEGDDDDNLLRYTIDVFLNDEDMSGTPYYTISSQVDARNAMQIPEITGGGASIGAIAFLGEIGNAIITPGSSTIKPVNVALVLDVSSSMTPAKLNALKDASVSFCEQLLPIGNLNEGNVNIALVPFDQHVRSEVEATRLRPLNDTNYQRGKELVRDLGFDTPASGTVVADRPIWGSIKALTAPGSTNQVDGLRRAYWAIKDKLDGDAASGISTDQLNYIILFSDGVPNALPRLVPGGDFWHPYNSTYPFVDNGIRQNIGLGNLKAAADIQKYGDYMNFWRQKSIDDFGNCELYFVMVGTTADLTTADILARRMFLTTDDTNGDTAPLDSVKYRKTTEAAELTLIFEEIAGGITLDSYSHLEGPND